jgi:HEAT repeat protein
VPYRLETHFVSDPMPRLGLITGDPLEHAATRIGLDLERLSLPRPYEAGYRTQCRFPLIDALLDRPLYLRAWVEETASSLRGRQAEEVLEAASLALALLRGVPDTAPMPLPSVDAEVARLGERLVATGLRPDYMRELLLLYEAVCQAGFLVIEAQRDLSAEDLAYFARHPGAYLAPDGRRMVAPWGGAVEQQAVIARARRVRYERLFRAANVLIHGVGRYVAAMAELPPLLGWGAPESATEPLVFDSPLGPVVIGGLGDDEYAEDAMLLVDLGGDDVYRNNAGGCRPGGGGIAVLIDHGGHDRYLAAGRRFVQGAACLGVGLLVDLGGSDLYQAGHFSQGAGVMGVGLLWDRDGDDTYRADTFCQGAGMFGLGMVLEDAGEDLYDCASLGQGAATTLGMGILSDLGGDDRYHLNIGPGKDTMGGPAGFGQGGALSFRPASWEGALTAHGGIGLLLDAGGNDRYRGAGRQVQGGGHLLSVGALVDLSGHDHYTARSGQGSAAHLAAAILLDRRGDDIYECESLGGGAGDDRVLGLFLDLAGDDRYQAGASSFGAATGPLARGLFIDYRGGDTYVSEQSEVRVREGRFDSFGGVLPESEPQLWPQAICLDLQGKDDYGVRNRADNSERHSFGHGIDVDTEWEGDDVLPAPKDPLGPYGPSLLPETLRRSRYYRDIQALQQPDLFGRFQVIGRLTAGGGDAVRAVVSALTHTSEQQQARDLLEVLHWFFAAGRVGRREIPHLLPLLRARAPEVRAVVAADLGLWRADQAREALRETLGDPDAAVRRAALEALLRLEAVQALPRVRELLAGDPDPEVRRLAARFLGRIRDDVSPLRLLVRALQRDSAPAVRCAAALALGHLEATEALEPLREAARSEDLYLRRAAAEALLQLGEIEGLEILIDSLAFPSIDAFYNGDHNLPNLIAAYAGQDLPEDRRYDAAAWKSWLERNRESIDLQRTVAQKRALDELEESLRARPLDERIAALESHVAEHPADPRAQRILARLHDQAARARVYAPQESARFDAQGALEHARRAMELDPRREYAETLAEAYLVAGEIDRAEELCRRLLERFPEDEEARERLARCRAARRGAAAGTAAP